MTLRQGQELLSINLHKGNFKVEVGKLPEKRRKLKRLTVFFGESVVQ